MLSKQAAELFEKSITFTETLSEVLTDQQERLTTIRALLIDYNLALSNAMRALKAKNIPVSHQESETAIRVRLI